MTDAYAAERNRYEIAGDVRLIGKGILLYGEGSIVIGPGSHVNQGCIVQAWQGCEVRIGRYARIGPRVCIYTRQYIADQNLDVPDGGAIKYKQGDVQLGAGVWVGAHSVITPGVTVGDNAVIGANSLVKDDVPAYAIAYGVPAEVRRFKSCRPQEVAL